MTAIVSCTVIFSTRKSVPNKVTPVVPNSGVQHAEKRFEDGLVQRNVTFSTRKSVSKTVVPIVSTHTFRAGGVDV